MKTVVLTRYSSILQDNISQKPITVTLTGLQGEYFYSVNQIEDTISKVVPTLSLVKQFLPKFWGFLYKWKTRKTQKTSENKSILKKYKVQSEFVWF